MQDFLLDDSGDLAIQNGDFLTGESTEQEIDYLLTSFRGEWKEYPLVGAEIQRMLKAREGVVRIRSVVQEQLKADGFRTVDFEITNSEEISINAER